MNAEGLHLSNQVGMGWDGKGRDGMGQDGMGWDGMGWDGMGWDADLLNVSNITNSVVVKFSGLA